LKSPFINLLISLVALLFNASTIHSTKYFIHPLDEKTNEPLGVIDLAFGADSTKIIQITYLEDETSDLNKEILQALLKATFAYPSKESKDLLAKMDFLILPELLGQSDILTYIKEVRMEKINSDDTENWLLNVLAVNKQIRSGYKEELTVGFKLRSYTPQY
jgi:hypothetical protein